MSEVWVAIALAGAGTYAMRASFLAVAGRLAEVPQWANRILRQIPPAVLAAIILPSLIRPEGTVDLLQPRFAAGLFAALVAWKTRSVALTLALGIGGLMALEAVWPW